MSLAPPGDAGGEGAAKVGVTSLLDRARQAVGRVRSAHEHRLRMISAWARHDADTYRAFTDTLRALGQNPIDSRILDIGCGPNAPMTVMLHAAGARVTGIDEHLGYRWGLGFRPDRYRRYWQKAGPFKTARKALGELVYDRPYYATLAEVLGLPLTEAGLDLRPMKAEALASADGCFDAVHSNATWEHLRAVEVANREVTRVLRPAGLAYVEIHLFPSLSGGHDLPWIVPGTTELGGATPWRHLRDPTWQSPVYLNRLREHDYRQLFEATPGLEIVEWRTEFTEGEELLDAALLAELSGYTRAELTRRSIIAVLRKRGAG
jgi:SAM-dependent methyltransferase